MENNEILKQYGNDYTNMTISLLKAADLKTRIEKKFPMGDVHELCIGIKPNLVCPTPADYGATTHPEVVEGIIRYLRDYDFKNIIMLEGSWIGDKTSEAYEYCGYRALSEKYGVEFVDTQTDRSHKKDCAGMELTICDVVNRVDYLINVPVLKGHCQTNITCALKNMKGLIPNSEKRRFHTMGLHEPIAHLSRGIIQDFIVVDHICGDLDFEEGGNPAKTDCIMVAADPVLLDSYVCRLLGYPVSQVPYLGLAEKLGSGSSNLSECMIRVLDSEGNELKSFMGDEDDPYETDVKSAGKLLEVSYTVDDYDSCSACYGNLAPALYRLKEEGILEKLYENLGCKISIGQGHKGKTGRFGVGNCCQNFDAYIKGCPPQEEDIYEELKRRA